MPRIRTLKPEFPQSESMGRVSREARLCFILLWTIADDAGRLRASSRMLASLLYPYDDDAPGKIEAWLCELEREGCVRRYEGDGNKYLDMPNWLKHQKIDRPSPSRIPPFVEGSRVLVEDSTTDLGPRTLDQDLGSGPRNPLKPPRGGETGFDRFWQTFPRKEGKKLAERAYRKATMKIGEDELLAAAGRYRDDPNREPEYTAHASTWLNQERWNNPPLPPRKGKPNDGKATPDDLKRGILDAIGLGAGRTGVVPGPSPGMGIADGKIPALVGNQGGGLASPGAALPGGIGEHSGRPPANGDGRMRQDAEILSETSGNPRDHRI